MDFFPSNVLVVAGALAAVADWLAPCSSRPNCANRTREADFVSGADDCSITPGLDCPLKPFATNFRQGPPAA